LSRAFFDREQEVGAKGGSLLKSHFSLNKNYFWATSHVAQVIVKKNDREK